MPRPEIDEQADFSDRLTRFRISALLTQFVAAAEGEYEIRIRPVKTDALARTNRQLRWYWACIVKPLFGWMQANGWEVACEDDAHRELGKKYLLVPLLRDRNGVPIRWRVRSTGELTAGEMADYCEKCRDLMAHYCGINVPDPDPAWRENAEPTTAGRGRQKASV